MASGQPSYRIVAWRTCPWCVKAQELLDSQNLTYEVEYCERNTEELQEAKKRNNWSTVPMITAVQYFDEGIQETFIGGYDNLAQLLSEPSDGERG
tara:strand:+ start:1946 stop:2230 length:285 start_codon:yes stop_codon:yes gene_type:complete